MISVKLRGVKELNKVTARLEEKVASGSEQLVFRAAEELKNDIRSSWSAISPSLPGNPPAIVTGNLDSSIQVDKQGRSLLGRFAKKEEVKLLFVRADASKGIDPRGRGDYAPVLEYALDRQFMTPAIERLERRYGDIAKKEIKL